MRLRRATLHGSRLVMALLTVLVALNLLIICFRNQCAQVCHHVRQVKYFVSSERHVPSSIRLACAYEDLHISALYMFYRSATLVEVLHASYSCSRLDRMYFFKAILRCLVA